MTVTLRIQLEPLVGTTDLAAWHVLTVRTNIPVVSAAWKRPQDSAGLVASPILRIMLLQCSTVRVYICQCAFHSALRQHGVGIRKERPTRG
jgi:hypothetical protein